MRTGSASPRVLVTGIGSVCGWGRGVEALWAGLGGGATAIGPFSRIDHRDYPTHVAAEVPAALSGDDAAPRLERPSVADRFAVEAAREALRGAGLPDALPGIRAGLYFGSSTGGMFESEGWYRALLEGPPSRARVGWLASQQVSAPGEAVARAFGIRGPVETISSACSSSTLAIGAALDELRAGTIDLAVVGGSDSLCRITYAGFNALRSVDEAPSRPFRSDRRGLSLGEGAAVLVLENEDSARARGARPLAVLAGAGASCDAHHMTAPEPAGAGAEAAMREALDDAGLAPGTVDFINTHGTGTPLNDTAEFRAILALFGERGRRIPVTASKASVGHLLGSAGAIEAVATVLSLMHGQVPPTPGAGEIDPEAAVRLVCDEPLFAPLSVGLTLNLAFGGCNGALVFTGPEPR